MVKGSWVPRYIGYDETATIAEGFLREHNPTRTIPIPIEEIAESRLNISIVVLPDLKMRQGLDSYLEPDLQSIFIDEDIFDYLPRARLSIAHEIGHRTMHGAFYGQADFRDSDDYKDFRKETLTGEADKRFEIQAFNFAGLVLVPRDELNTRFDQGLVKARDAGFEPHNSPIYFLDYVSAWLSKEFLVTESVIKKRVEFDNLWPLF